jgi:uncharacterized spore protein YtfJ
MISPEALLIVEPARTYAVSLTGKEITLDQLLEMAPSLWEIVEKGQAKSMKKGIVKKKIGNLK